MHKFKKNTSATAEDKMRNNKKQKNTTGEKRDKRTNGKKYEILHSM